MSCSPMRRTKPFDTAFLNGPIEQLHESMGRHDYAGMGWEIIDNRTLSIEETVDLILRQTRVQA
jgi:hypothetical protein